MIGKNFFLNKIKILTPQVSPKNEEKQRIGQYLNFILLSVIVLLSVLCVYRLATNFNLANPTNLFLLIILVIMILLRVILQYGYIRPVSIAFTAITWAAMTYQAFTSDGIRDVAITAYIVILLSTSLLLGRNYSLPFFGLSITAMWIMAVEQATQVRVFSLDNPINTASYLTVIFSLVLVTSYLLLKSLEKALSLTREQLEELKQAEEAARKSEEKFRILFETSRDFLYITNMDGSISDFNKAASSMSGYSEDELKKINIQDLYNDANEREILLKKILEQGFVENYEIKGKKKDGTSVHVLVNSTTLKDATGNVVGLQGSIKDISERKRAEQALRESEERFARLSSVASEGIGIGEQGKILDANARLAEMLGYQEEELLGMNIMDIVAPESHDLVSSYIKSGFEGPYEHLVIRKDGSTFPVEVLDRSVPYKGRQAKATIVRDITRRKRAEEALRESEERFSMLSSVTYEGIAISEKGIIVDANPQLAGMLGYEPGGLVGLNAMDFVAPESRDLVFHNMSAGIEGPYEHLALRKNGSLFPVEIRARSVSYRGRKARVTIIRDITKRKLAEEGVAHQVERLSTLHNIEQAILSSMDLNLILKHLVREIVSQLHVDSADVLLFDPQTKRLNFASGEGFRTGALKYTALEIGTGLAGLAAQQREIVQIADLAEIKDNPSLSQAIAGEKFITYFSVPLIAKDQLHGVLEIFHRASLDPDPEWLAFLKALAGQAAISIDNARLLERNQQSLKETDALYRINQDLVASIDAEQLMSNVVNLLQKIFDYHYVQIFTVDPASGDFVMRAGSGKTGKQLKRRGHRLAAGEGIVGFTAETGMPFFSNNVDEVVFFERDPLLPEVKSELAVQIKTGDQFLGLLDIQQVPPATLSPRDVQLVSAVADQLAVALQKAFLYADLQEALRQEQATRSQLIHSERLAIAGRLLASVSHELNNPLQAIQNALFLLKDEGTISSQGQADLKIILSETERMATMLERLRATYRPFRVEDFQPVVVNDLIKDVNALMATHLRNHQISFEFDPDPELPAIPGLSDQLRQVILNLFMNAAEAMADGGLLIASTDFVKEGKEIMISITDTGPGIDPAILPNIFEAFVTNKEGGTGLGLAIVHEIVIKHGGRIEVANNPLGGAAFMLWLPVENRGLA
jgi:PAS domain S-box-containing protein